MGRIFATAAIAVPMLGQVAAADEAAPSMPFTLQVASADPFDLDPAELDPIRYSRVDPAGSFDAPPPAAGTGVDARTELSFTLRPRRPDFSREGLYGLGLIGVPSLAVQRAPGGDAEPGEALPDLHEGLAYSAGVRVEREDGAIDGTAYVSSSLLGLSYGRLGRLWYGGIDVNLERFDDEAHGAEQPDVVSLDLTTGRRLGITGLGSDDPMWLLSVRGNLDLLDQDGLGEEDPELRPSWFLNPSLFWQHPGFTFSAQMQLPVAPELDESEQPDYRLRAVFEKRFR